MLELGRFNGQSIVIYDEDDRDGVSDTEIVVNFLPESGETWISVFFPDDNNLAPDLKFPVRIWQPFLIRGLIRVVVLPPDPKYMKAVRFSIDAPQNFKIMRKEKMEEQPT